MGFYGEKQAKNNKLLLRAGRTGILNFRGVGPA
jgi:hypothetical protein